MVATNQQFNLRWNNHTGNILQVFLEHLSSESLVDVTLSCQGRFIRAHKIILSACSPYFQEVFANHTDKHPIVILKGIKYTDLESIIKFMYNGEIRVQEAQLDELLAAAETLRVKGLSNVRSKYEKGEITSLNPAQKSTLAKVADASAITSKKELPMHAIKAAVALFAPTVKTTRAPNTSGIATNAAVSRVPLYRAVTTGVSRVADIRPSGIVNRGSVSVATAITPSTIRGNDSPRTVAAVRSVDDRLEIVRSERDIATVGDSNDPRDRAICDKIPVTGGALVEKTEKKSDPIIVDVEESSCSGVATTDTKVTKSAEIEAPRVRKRRKMSHTVNELARETVFASNGTVLLEPDEAVVKSLAKMKKISSETRGDNADNCDIDDVVGSTEPNKPRVAKQPRSSLLVVGNKEAKKIPRPPNAFMIFANEWKRKIAPDYKPSRRGVSESGLNFERYRKFLTEETNSTISVKLGIMWKGLTSQEKETYYELARKAEEEHKRKYPGYSYCSRADRLKKKNMLRDLYLAKCLPPRDSEAQRIVNGEERRTDRYTDTDSSEYEDNDDAVEQDYESEIEVVHCSEEEDDSNRVSRESAKRTGSVSFGEPSSTI